jgi:predicted enzyme related to lactoylglutathione lyase
MSERDSYPAGVPCWISNLQRDVPAARDFYEQLLGWTTAGPDGVPREDATYAVGRIRGRDVAGIGTMPAEAGDLPATWVTEVRVDDLETTVERVAAAGGTVVRSEVDLTPMGRLAVLHDPAGALFCAWEAGRREGAQIVNEPGAWSMSALQTPDRAGAIRFYEAVFGWQAEDFGPVTLLRLPGYVGGEPSQPVPRDVVAVIGPDGASAGAPARWSVDFWVADIDAAAASAERLGGRVIAGPYDAPPSFRQAVLADREGATFGASQLVAVPVP